MRSPAELYTVIATEHDVPHGLGNARALPAVTAFNESALGDKAALVAQAFGASSPAEGLSKLRRDVAAVVANGKVSPAAAREHYGLV